MRSGALISALCHVGLVSLVMLSTPREFGAATERAIEAELVRADEIEQPKEQPQQPKEEPKPDKPSVWDFPPEKPLIQLPGFSPEARPNPSAPAPSQSAAGTSPAPAPSAACEPPQSAPANSQQAALTPQAQSPQSSISQQAPFGAAPPKAAPSVFDPANIPMLMDLPNAQGGAVEKGFDFEATVTANISSDERAAFKAHLRKCWKLPDGVSSNPNTRVVLRIYLKRDGALASEPVLIEASASRDGPAVLQAAKRALAACQPYSFPAEKYREWRILDLTFTPRDMAGG
jgi:hypothetical protein